jgi:polyisoprenoid-binding protein YceI
MAASMNMAKDPADSYVLESGKSRFQVKASASGVLSVFGHNPTIAIRGFTGEAWFRAQEPEQSSLQMEIDTRSLEVAGDASEKDRAEMNRTMHEEVLETDRYPVIRFAGSGTEATKIADGMYRVTLSGKLSLHGAERDVVVPCNVIAGEESLRANGEFTIRQTDFGIRLVSVAAGGLKLKDELKCSFDIAAVRRRGAGND